MDSPNSLALARLAADRGDWEAVGNWLLEADLVLDGAEVLKLSLQVLTQGDFQDSWQVAKVLPKLGDRVIEPLLAILQNTDLEPAAHWFAGSILGSLDSELVVESIAVQLGNSDITPELLEILVQVLTDLGVLAIQHLSKLLTIPEHRQLAVQALAHIRHSQTIEPLLLVVQDPSPELRAISIEALGSFHDARIPPLLLAALTDPNSAVRRWAVVGLGMRADLAVELQLVDRLQLLLSDLKLEVCLAAALALGRIGSDSAAVVLWNCYQKNTCPAALRQQIVLALGSIDQPITVEYLQQSLESTDPEMALLTLRSLARLKNQQSSVVQILANYLQKSPASNTARIRQEIAAILGNMAHFLAVESLVLLLADQDERVRWQAMYCLKQQDAAVLERLKQLAKSLDSPPALIASIQQLLLAMSK
jgi:HEAT repeat protein